MATETLAAGRPGWWIYSPYPALTWPAFEPLAGIEVCLPVTGHQTTSTPIERAVPAMIFAAASTSLAFRSFIFFSAICLS